MDPWVTNILYTNSTVINFLFISFKNIKLIPARMVMMDSVKFINNVQNTFLKPLCSPVKLLLSYSVVMWLCCWVSHDAWVTNSPTLTEVQRRQGKLHRRTPWIQKGILNVIYNYINSTIWVQRTNGDWPLVDGFNDVVEDSTDGLGHRLVGDGKERRQTVYEGTCVYPVSYV